MKIHKHALSSFEIVLITLGFVFSIILSISALSSPLTLALYWSGLSAYHSYVSSIYEQTNKFFSIDNLTDFFKSKYNLSANEYFLFDSAAEIETTYKCFFATGQDYCRKHGVNCQKNVQIFII